MEEYIARFLREHFEKNLDTATKEQLYEALLCYTKEQTEKQPLQTASGKKLYYLSAEFLVGRMLNNHLLNLGLYEQAQQLLNKYSTSLEKLEELEPEPSLGNGGLGRLAACFLDSIATLGLNGEGVGLNYHFGLFRQKFEKNSQREFPDCWIQPQGWLRKTDTVFPVHLGEISVLARMYEADVTGYHSDKRILLKLFDLEQTDESLVKNGIEFDKTDIAHNLTLFLYPDDSDEDGKMLRLYQQYFLVSAAAQMILRETKERGYLPQELDRAAVIQINDTHPTLIIPELIRLLTEEGIALDKAVRIVSKTCAYTNHTILAEALEKWQRSSLEKAVPQLIPIIEHLDRRAKALCGIPKTAIIDTQDRVHMAHLAIHYGFSVNGVAKLHTDILKNSELSDFYHLYPEKFHNETNGITFRRWLMLCNPPLSRLITRYIGEGWKTNALELEKLLQYREDDDLLNALLQIKAEQKQALAQEIKRREGICISPDSIYDIQIKRLHEYKRQQMNALYAIWKYFQIKQGILPPRPITLIFGAKAAPAYTIAKDIIHLLLCLQQLFESDPQVSPHLKLVVVENYNVSYAQKLIPACDISEQISLASKEASGTGNMKMMLNGAVTLGTMDGANVEIYDLVGEENICIFGKSSEEVLRLYQTKGYSSKKICQQDREIKKLVDFLLDKRLLALGNAVMLRRLHRELMNKDWFMTLLDLKEYIAAKERVFALYENRREWSKKMLVNIAKAGYFSSDRTIASYCRDIWKL